MRFFETLRRMYWTGQLAYQGEASLARKLRWWRRGFRPKSAVLYRFPVADQNQYVNDYAENYRSLHLNPVESIFEHKTVQHGLLQAAGAAMPELLGIIYRGRAVLRPLTPRAEPVEIAELERALVAHGGEYIIKPDCGGGGDKVALLGVQNGALARQDKGRWAPFALAALMRDVMLVQRRAEQAPFWRALNPGSLNTIRFLTLWRTGERAPFIAAAAQRIGTAASAPVDNVSRGGLVAPIDAVTGRIGRAVSLKKVEQWFTHHPDNGAPIEGMVIPGWDAIRAEVLRLAGALPLNCFVGWDVFVNPEGRVAACEVNGARTSVAMVQLERGLLADERVRGYYEEQQAL
jgi:hypothetical protein